MKAESFINIVNNGVYYSLWEIPNRDVKLVKGKLDYSERHTKYCNRDITYAICTNLYKCEDDFVMVSGVCYITEDTYALPKDIGVKCRAILYKFAMDEKIEPSVFGGLIPPPGPNFNKEQDGVDYDAEIEKLRSSNSEHKEPDLSRWLPKDCEVKTMNIADGGSVKDKLFESSESEPKHPDYYKGTNDGGRSIEVFDIIDQFVDGDFYLGNVLKYVCRAGKKSKETKRQDLEKALHYIKEAIKRV